MARRKKGEPAEPKIGHNGGPLTDDRRRELRGYISELERMDAQKAAITADMAEYFASAKDRGYDVKAIRAVLRERKKDRSEHEAFEATCDAYKQALGMLSGTPLGDAAMRRDLGGQVDLEQAIAAVNGLSPEPPADVSSPPFHLPADA